MADPENNSPDVEGDLPSQGRDSRQIDIRHLLKQLTGEPSCSGNHALSIYLENSPDPVLLFDEKSEVIAKNHRALELWDGKVDFLPSRLINQVAKVRTRNSSFHKETNNGLVTIESLAGRRYFLPTVFRLFDSTMIDSEAPFKCVIACVLKDETARERSDLIRNTLLASISHELNTPLTSARLALYLLAEQQIGKLNENQMDMVERAKQDLDREIISIQNVIDLIRSEGVQLSNADAEELNIHELVEEAISDFEEQIELMHLPITRSYSSSSLRVAMERETAELVIHQLFASLIKYTDEGASLEIATAVKGGYCSLELTTKNDEQEDFLPDDLFTMPMESPEIGKLHCADLGLRVAHEMVGSFGGSLSSERFSNSGKLLFRFPHINR